MLIERYKITPDQAFQLLVQASMHVNRKVRDLADELVRTGELPAVPPRAGGRQPGTVPAAGRPGPDTPHHS